MLPDTCHIPTRAEDFTVRRLALRTVCLWVLADTGLLIGEDGCSVEMVGEDCE